jgi:D-3-phosphoglycerate dehydrogenase
VKVAVVSSAFSLEAPRVQELIESGVDFVHINRNVSTAEFSTALLPFHVVIAGTEKYPRELLDSLSDLRIIARTGVGTEGIDIPAADERGIEVFTTPGLNAEAVAEHALALLLTVLHRVVVLDHRTKEGLWRDGLLYRTAFGANVGVIGYGQIGRRFSDLVRALGAKVKPYDPYVSGEGVRQDLLEVLGANHVFSIHVPLNDETKGLIGSREIARMPSGSVLINTSRGGVVDEDALVEALESGHLAGAGLDVFATEPVKAGLKVAAMPNVVLSPHISSFSEGAITSMSNAIAERISELRGT